MNVVDDPTHDPSPNQVAIRKVRLLKAGFPNKTIFVLGSTGSGKTTLIANLILQCPRFVLFDTRNEYDPFFFTGNVTLCGSLTEFCAALNEVRERIIYKLTDNQEAILEGALNCLYTFQEANAANDDLPPLTVILDELNRFADTNSWPETLQEIVQRGRDFKIEKIFGAQWFGTIPTWVRDSFSEIYVFRHSDPNGLKLLERFGFDADDIKNLPLHVCLHTGKNGIEKIRLIANGEQ